MALLLPKSGVFCPTLRGSVIRRLSSNQSFFRLHPVHSISLGVFVALSGYPVLVRRVVSFLMLDGFGAVGLAMLCVGIFSGFSVYDGNRSC
jgi:hypothetical protein